LIGQLPSNKTIFIYYNFPAGYLFTPAIALTNTVYLPYSYSHDRLSNLTVTDYLKKNLPDYVLQVKYFESRIQSSFILDVPDNNEIKKFFLANSYRISSESKIGNLYIRTDP
jgi:hypothetical protein